MAANINRVVLVGNLTRDPELRHTPSGMAVCSLRIAVNTRRKDSTSGEWTEKPNYFDITVWGNQGESCAQYLSKGRPVAVDGRLDWREWDAQDGTEAPGGRDRRRQRPVPRRPRWWRRGRRRQPVRARGRVEWLRRRLPGLRRRHSVLRRDRVPAPKGNSDRERSGGRGKRNAPAGPGRRKSCFFCKSKVDEVDYKNVNELRRYVSEKGKIRNRRISGACRRHQRQVAVAVKRARELALLPYVGDK